MIVQAVREHWRWILALLVATVGSGGLGATMVSEIRLHTLLEDNASEISTLKEWKSETSRQLAILIRNECYMLEIIARDRQVFFPQECDAVIGKQESKERPRP